uniref:T cell receptor beta variable 30 n=1 Tax=Crocodylus porosus TaxID=8502 RepID=A0A7M4DXS9_CROPO
EDILRIVLRPCSFSKPGSPASLECSLEGQSNPNFYWYRQLPGGEIHLLAYSIGVDQVGDTGPKHIHASRTTDKKFTLSIKPLLANDTGVYYCAWSHTLGQVGTVPKQKLPLPPPHIGQFPHLCSMASSSCI